MRYQSLFVPVCVVSLLLLMLIPMVSAENYSFVTKWGRGNANGEFQFPESVAIDSSGNVYVADRDNHRIQKFAPSVANSPVASLIATPKSGRAPLPVYFYDTSTGLPTSWNWSFGDGNYSSLQNPVHTYDFNGVFTVNLKVSNGYGDHTLSQNNYITVSGVNSTTSSKIGVVRSNNTWLLDKSGNGVFGAGDLAYTFGKSGDVFVTGDWNADGKTEIGVVRNSNSWLLDASGNGAYGAGDIAYTFGKAGDVFVTGDWNTDGKTEIGIVRNSNTWLLDASGNGAYGSGDQAYTFGKTGDIYVTGDWNADGKTEIGVIRNINTWLLDASGNGAYGSGDSAYTFGKAGDKHITGDWNNDVKSEMGVIRNSNAWLLDASGNGAYGAGDYSYTFGRSGDIPVSGKWAVPPLQPATNIQMIADVYGMASNPSAGIDQIHYTIGLAPGAPSLNLEMMNVVYSTPTFGPKILVWTAGTSSTADTNFIALKNGSGTSQSIMSEGDQMHIIFNMTVVPKNTKMNITSIPSVGSALPFSKTTPAIISTINVLY